MKSAAVSGKKYWCTHIIYLLSLFCNGRILNTYFSKVPNLTDRKEWLSAHTSVKLYGKELLLSDLIPGTDFHQFNPPKFKDLQRVQPKDEFSSLPVYEQTLSRMKKFIADDPEGYPAKILLTGKK